MQGLYTVYCIPRYFDSVLTAQLLSEIVYPKLAHVIFGHKFALVLFRTFKFPYISVGLWVFYISPWTYNTKCEMGVSDCRCAVILLPPGLTAQGLA